MNIVTVFRIWIMGMFAVWSVSCAAKPWDATEKPSRYLIVKFAGQVRSDAGFLVPCKEERLTVDDVFAYGLYYHGPDELRALLASTESPSRVILSSNDVKLTVIGIQESPFEPHAPTEAGEVNGDTRRLGSLHVHGKASLVELMKFRGQSSTSCGLVVPTVNWAPDPEWYLEHGQFFRNMAEARAIVDRGGVRWTDSESANRFFEPFRRDELTLMFINEPKDPAK